MNLEGIMLSKIGQSAKDKYGMISVTCGIFFFFTHMWNLRKTKQINERDKQTNKKKTDS